MSYSHDAIIVGAGPAGAAIATQLADSGRHVLLVDACAFPRSKVCGEFLSPRIWPSLESLQVVSDVRARAIPLDRFELVLPQARSTEIKFQDGEAQPVAISRYVFDQLLVDRAQAAGVQTVFGLRVRKVQVERGNATGIVASEVDTRGRLRTWSAPLIVGADGRRSVVVRETGQLRRDRSNPHVGFKAHLRVPGELAARAEGRLSMHSLPGGYVGVCPAEDGTLNVCGVMPAQVLRHARGAIDVALASWSENDPQLKELLSRGRAVRSWLFMPDVSRQLAKPQVGGVLYVGDAQGTTDPVAGQGMTLALESAMLLGARLLTSGQSSPDARLQELAQQQWQRCAGARRRRAAFFGWLLQHPLVSGAAWRAAAPLPGSRQHVLRRAYRASMASKVRHQAA